MEQDVLFASKGIVEDPVPVASAGVVASFDPPRSFLRMAASGPAPDAFPHVVIYLGEGLTAQLIASQSSGPEPRTLFDLEIAFIVRSAPLCKHLHTSS